MRLRIMSRRLDLQDCLSHPLLPQRTIDVRQMELELESTPI